MMGQLIVSTYAGKDTKITVPKGVYLVKIGEHPAKKVVVLK